MKFVMDERIKHRLTGMVVIVAIAAIFLPAVLKKSNQHIEENVNLSVRLPAKPPIPKVEVADKNTLFKSIKVAEVSRPTVAVTPRPMSIAKAEPLSIKSVVLSAPIINKQPAIAKAESVGVPAVKVVAVSSQKQAKAVVLNKQMYAVQLASFTQQENAKSLVTRLRSKGYIATYNKFTGKKGEVYKVTVGQLNQIDEAKNLQKKVATSMQLNGFVVKPGVS